MADEANEGRQAAARDKALADEANEQHQAATRDKPLANEVNKRRRHEAATWEKALADEANKQCQAAARQKALAKDKRRQEESAAIRRIQVQCALLAAPLDAILAEIERDNITHEANKQQWAAAREKALADEADKLRQAAAWDKALADKANELLRRLLRGRKGWPTSYVRQPCGRKRWRTRPTSNVGRPRGRKCWPTRSTSDVADHQLWSTANPRRHVAAADLVFVLVATMAPEPPIHRSTFFAGGDIRPALPTNLL